MHYASKSLFLYNNIYFTSVKIPFDYTCFNKYDFKIYYLNIFVFILQQLKHRRWLLNLDRRLRFNRCLAHLANILINTVLRR